MSVNKWLSKLVVLLAVIVVVTISNSPGVFAESRVATQPMETVKAIEVQLNDNYFHHYFQWKYDNVDIEKRR